MARTGLGGTVLEAPPGKFRVIGIDKWDNSDWLVGDFDSLDAAKEGALKAQKENAYAGSDKEHIGTHYIYNDRGNFLGGVYDGEFSRE